MSYQPDGRKRDPRLIEQYSRRAEVTAASDKDEEAHRSDRIEHHSAVLDAIRAKRGEALRLNSSGETHDEVLRSIEWELDLQQVAAESHL